MRMFPEEHAMDEAWTDFAANVEGHLHKGVRDLPIVLPGTDAVVFVRSSATHQTFTVVYQYGDPCEFRDLPLAARLAIVRRLPMLAEILLQIECEYVGAAEAINQATHMFVRGVRRTDGKTKSG